MDDNLFAKIPIALIKCGLLAELKPATVVVYNVLLSYANFQTGMCFPSISTICSLSGLSRQTVINAIYELEDWGLLQVLRRQGSHNVYQLKYWWGSGTASRLDSGATSIKTLTGGVKNFNEGSKSFSTRTTTTKESHLNSPNVVNNRQGSSDSSAGSGLTKIKKAVYQLKISIMQEQQAWVKAIQEGFKRLFFKELPAELIDEKIAQGVKAQFILEILKNIDDPVKIRNPIGWFRSIDENWDV
jgi:DNA-binding transcriptional regulator YhcF (GntR family)